MCVRAFLRNVRSFSSSLYITASKAKENFVLLTPYIDFGKRLEDKAELARNVALRKLDIDVESLDRKWEYFQMLEHKKQLLELARVEIGTLIAKTSKEVAEDSDDLAALRLHSKLVKNDLRNLKDYSAGVEEQVMESILSFPNVLHALVPAEDEVILTHLQQPSQSSKCHMEIAKEREWIEYRDPMTCYLLNDAALFEYALSNVTCKFFKEANYVQFSNAHFARSPVVEGCDPMYHDQFLVISEGEKEKNLNKLLLPGGASLSAFMAYFTKHTVRETYFPLRYFTWGRVYRDAVNAGERDLFGLCQETSAQVFVALKEDDDADTTFKSIYDELGEFYKSLDCHFRFVLSGAPKLSRSECLKMSIQMFSNKKQDYVEVGYLSFYDSYISKRLLFNYFVDKEIKFPKVIAGNVVNVQRLLACIIENQPDQLLTTSLKQHLPF